MAPPTDAVSFPTKRQFLMVGLLRLELHLPEAQSLKDKRSIVKSLKERLRGRFNVATAELDPSEKWQLATLGVTTVGTDRRFVEGVLRSVVEWVEASRVVELVQVEHEFY